MNLLKNSLRLLIVFSTLSIESKISIQKSKDSVFKLLKHNKQENIINKECFGVKQFELLCQSGNICIHTWKQSSTMIEIKKVGSQSQIDATDIKFLQYDGILQINTVCNDSQSIPAIHFNIILPEKTSVKIATKNGNISIKNLFGFINAKTDYGNIDIIYGSSNVSINSKRGNLVIQRENMIDTDIINAIAENGDISLRLTQNINCDIKAKAKGGKIYSDLFITLKEQKTKLTDDIYKKQQQQLYGFISNDSIKPVSGLINIETYHGSIKIKNFI